MTLVKTKTNYNKVQKIMTTTSDKKPTQSVALSIDGRATEIEYRLINPGLGNTDLIIFLHEGLGSVSMWRDWPDQLCETLQCRGLVYSRYGYGQSTARLPGDLRTPRYLHTEAEFALPALLQALNLSNERPILFGHSDGGSIALLYAALYPDRVKAIAVAAPHIFVEDITLDGIVQAAEIARTTDLIPKLGRHHRNPQTVFSSWNDTWRLAEFREWNIEDEVSKIRCPILAIQGENDEYGTLEQIKGIKQRANQAQLCIIPDCGHSPHRESPSAVNSAMLSFVQSIKTA